MNDLFRKALKQQSQFGSCSGQGGRWTLNGPLEPSSNICKWALSLASGDGSGSAKDASPEVQTAVAALPTARDAPSRSPAQTPAQPSTRATWQAPSPALIGCQILAASLRQFSPNILETTFPRGSCDADVFQLYSYGGGGGAVTHRARSLSLEGPRQALPWGGRDLRVWKKISRAVEAGAASRRRAALFTQRPLGSAVTWSRAPPSSTCGSSSLPGPWGSRCGGNSRGKRRDQVGLPHLPCPASRRRRARASMPLPPGYHQRECPFYSVALRVFQA